MLCWLNFILWHSQFFINPYSVIWTYDTFDNNCKLFEEESWVWFLSSSYFQIVSEKCPGHNGSTYIVSMFLRAKGMNGSSAYILKY